jgi:hypothetical protein
MEFVERECCPACDGVRARTLLQRRFHEGALGQFLRDFYRREPFEGTYQLDECLDCELIFQRFIADRESMKMLYTGLATSEDDAPVPLHPGDKHELLALGAFIGKPRLRVLDYGTGWGAWPISARNLGHDAFATELAPHRASWAAAQGVTVISEEEIETNRPFDVINLEQVLEHVAEPLHLLQSLIPSLSGVLKLSLPNGRRRIVGELERDDFRHIMPFHPFEHVNSFNRHSLAKLIERLGLKEVRPSLRDLYSFRSTSVKDFARPIWRFYNPDNLYVWAMRSDV